MKIGQCLNGENMHGCWEMNRDNYTDRIVTLKVTDTGTMF